MEQDTRNMPVNRPNITSTIITTTVAYKDKITRTPMFSKGSVFICATGCCDCETMNEKYSSKMQFVKMCFV